MTQGIWRDLWTRRVPHAVGLYLGISWAVLEFVGFLVDQYLLSPHLVTFCLVVLASLIPSVTIIAYFHGRPGRQGWTRVEKVGVPTNLIALALLLTVMFSGKDLGAATTTVTVTDEEGITAERVIPKGEFRKRIILFPFTHESGNLAPDWLQYGLPLGVRRDLGQDLFVSATDGLEMHDQMTEAGYEGGLGLPVSLMREITENAHIRHFVSGSIAGGDEEVSVTMALHDARRGRVVDERTFSGTDVFQLIDSMSIHLKRSLGVPGRHIEEVTDLPISQIQTESIAAFRSAVEGYCALRLRSDWESAAMHFEAAVADDPTYASAQHALFQVYAISNRVQEGRAPIQAAMQHLYRLPESEQFEVKSDYYFIRQDYDRALAVYAMRVELSPDDLDARATLAQILLNQGRKDEAVAQYLAILESDPEQYDYLRRIGSVYETQGEFEDALEYYEAYAEQFPSDWASFSTIGNLHWNLGNHDQAKEQLEKALLLDPGNVDVIVGLAGIEGDLGNFESALGQLQEALGVAGSPEDSASAYEGLRWYHESRGQLGTAIEYENLAQAEREKYSSPVGGLMTRFRVLGIYIEADQTQRAREILEAVSAELTPPWDRMSSLGQMFVYLALEVPDSAERAVEGVESFIQDFSVQNMRPIALYARGRILEMRGEYEDAIVAFQEQIGLQPTDETIHEDLGRCYRKLGSLDESVESLTYTLSISPYRGSTHYELALTYLEMDERQMAENHLRTALDVWEDADPEFKPAQEARATLTELTTGSMIPEIPH